MSEQHNQHNNQENDDYTFLREKITERPINRRKVIRQSLLTIALAVTFALLACFVFFFLEKGAIRGYSNEQEAAKKISLTLQETTEEIMPEDMIKDENEENKDVPSTNAEDGATAIADAIAAYDPDIDDYQGIYNKMKVLSSDTSKSLVTVTAIQDKTSWLNSSIENRTKTTGVILEDNETDLLILCDAKVIHNASDIIVTFCNSKECSATVLANDSYTNFAILSVPLSDLNEATVEAIAYASFGNSATSCKPGDVVIAVGDPLGYGTSVGYGIISATDIEINETDRNFSLITTDIYGSQSGNGVLINKSGKIIGIISQKYNRKESENLISAIGITELNSLIEDLCNGVVNPHMGVCVTNVTSIAKQHYNIPAGAYITEIKLDSPAMTSGIHKGDVITAINDAVVTSVSDYQNELQSFKPGDVIVVTVMRPNGDAYMDINIKVTLSE